MKYNKKIPTILKPRIGLLLMLIAGILQAGCSDKLADITPGQTEISTVSSYDGQPIIEMNDLSFLEGSYFEHWRNRLAGNYGSELVRAVNSQTIKAKGVAKDFGSPIMLNKIVAGSKAKSDGVMSTHLRLSEPDGETEEFMLSVRRYIHDKELGKAKAKQLAAEDTWLALNPDRFYLQDDDEGNELWPVTFTAVNMGDSSRTMQVTFDGNGYVSSSAESSAHTKTTAGANEPNLVFVEPVSVMAEDECDSSTQFKDCGNSGGGGSGGGGLYCTEVSGRGEDTGGNTSGMQTYFTINSIRMSASVDGDQAAELQMFVKRDDDYDGECFPRSYKYRFDKVFRNDPLSDVPTTHSRIQGADKDDVREYYYEVPDVNDDDITYDFVIKRYEKVIQPNGLPGDYFATFVNFFPLFDFTNAPGPWRLVLSDDDKDYQDFSHRDQSDFATNIWTYDMNNGNWGEVFTGFSTDRKESGSSDDPVLESGVRRITKDNVQDRLGSNSNLVSSKDYSGGNFSYTFSLINY